MMRKIADVIGCKVGDFFRDELTETLPSSDGQTITCPKCGEVIRLDVSVSISNEE